MGNTSRKFGAALLTLTLGLLTFAVSAPPASAEPTVRVTTAIGDAYVPGRPVAFIVEITADRATEGNIVIRVDGRESARRPFDVAGGATKRFVVVTETLQWGPQLTVVVASDDGDVTLRPQLDQLQDTQTVGLLPSLQTADLPAAANAATGGRRVRLQPVEELVLAGDPRALGMFDAIAGSPDDFSTLAPEARTALGQWLVRGGTLAVDAPAGTGVQLSSEQAGALPEVGFGRLVYTDGQLRRGEVDGVLPAELTFIRDFAEQNFDPAESGRVLVADAGIETPGISLLILLVAGYIVLVGPVLFIVLRRTERQPLAWLLIPALAAMTVASVAVVGRAQRSDLGLAHATIVATMGDATVTRSEVLVASANGGFVGLEEQDGTSYIGTTFDRFGGLQASRLEERGDAIGFDLNPGEADRIVAEQVTTTGSAAALAVGVQVGAGRTLSGTVTNTSALTLQDVRVVAGNEVQLIGTMEPGEVAEVALADRFAALPLVEDSLYARMDRTAFDPFNDVDGAEGGAVNAGALAGFVQNYPEVRFTGTVMALGWTNEPPAPFRTDRGAEITRGRTGFMTIEPITVPADSEVLYGEAPARLIRLWDFEILDNRGGFSEFPTEMVLTLPEDHDPTDTFVLEIEQDITGLDLWNGSAWEPASDRILPNPDLLPLPDASIISGQVHLRVGLDQFGPVRTPVLRSATAAERDRLMQMAEVVEEEDG